jgi:hypothetical protein
MDKITEDIKNELGDFSKRFSAATVFPATVLSYNSTDDTVSVQLSNDAVIDDVRLRSVIKAGNKIIQVPSVNSVVQIASIENSKEFVVLAVEAIDKEVLIIGTVKLDIDNTGFLLQKGTATLKNILTNIIPGNATDTW